MGASIGGDILTITGINFGTDISSIEVIIDGVQCTVQSVLQTQITCETGPRIGIPENGNSFVVKVS